MVEEEKKSLPGLESLESLERGSLSRSRSLLSALCSLLSLSFFLTLSLSCPDRCA
jgi:hypothetical protein